MYLNLKGNIKGNLSGEETQMKKDAVRKLTNCKPGTLPIYEVAGPLARTSKNGNFPRRGEA